MARVTALIDDLDGGIAKETVAFTLDGVNYEIDLSADYADRLRERLVPSQIWSARISTNTADSQLPSA